MNEEHFFKSVLTYNVGVLLDLSLSLPLSLDFIKTLFSPHRQ